MTNVTAITGNFGAAVTENGGNSGTLYNYIFHSCNYRDLIIVKYMKKGHLN